MKTIDESLHYGYNIDVESAYINYLPKNETSVKFANECAESCKEVGMPYKLWEGFDGLKGEIKVPKELQKAPWLKWIKNTNITLDKGEVANFLTHVSLWAHCAEIDKPIVILEHDAIMLNAFKQHPAFNTIIYLGSKEQVENDFKWGPTPILLTYEGLRCLCRAHAYSIDPFIARRLLGNVIETGITKSIDVYMRNDIFTQIQLGIFAYDKNASTSVIQRNKSKEDQRICGKIF
jgi:hypothetical protein